VGVVVTEVHIDSSTSLIDLSDTERYEQALSLDTTISTGFDKSFSHLRAERAYLRPRARSFKRLSNVGVLSGKISNIGNGKGQEISLKAIF
jgi:hypothetical protein